MEHDFFHLIYTYLEERTTDNVRDNLDSDEYYQESKEKENNYYEEYHELDLPKEQLKIIGNWVDAMQRSNSAYTAVVFRMGMQYSFSLLRELADWN